MDASIEACSSSSGLGMSILDVFALGGAVMVWLVIGKRRPPEHIKPIETTNV